MSHKKNRKSKSSSKRPSKRPKRGSNDSANLSVEAVGESLKCEVGGEVALPEAEITQLCEAIVARHENVLRMRRDVLNCKDNLSTDLADTVLGPDRESRVVPWYPMAMHPSPEMTRPSRTIDYAAGEFYLQDAGSLLALAAAQADTDQLRGKLICDLCAAPGGKASGLLEAIDEPYRLAETTPDEVIPPRGFLLANEPIRSRVAPLAYNLARTGSDQYAITSEDPEVLADKFPGLFDFVLVDAPCSGQALVARGKQSATAVQTSQIELNRLRQNRILAAAERLLRPGGTIVYSTCTFAIKENEGQVRFMMEELGLTASPVQRLVDYRSDLPISFPGEALQCSYRLWPHRSACAGSFAARLAKPAAAETADLDRDRIDASWRRSTTSRSRDDAMVPRDAIEQLPFLICPDDRRHRFQLRDWIIDANAPDAPDWVNEQFVIGPEVAHRTGSTWKPSHAAAIRRNAAIEGITSLDVDDATASMYLSGQTIPATEQTGWQIVRHRGRPLGWIKSDGRIGKNHLARFARVE